MCIRHAWLAKLLVSEGINGIVVSGGGGGGIVVRSWEKVVLHNIEMEVQTLFDREESVFVFVCVRLVLSLYYFVPMSASLVQE